MATGLLFVDLGGHRGSGSCFRLANGLRRNRGSMGTDGDAEYTWGRQGCRVISVHKETKRKKTT